MPMLIACCVCKADYFARWKPPPVNQLYKVNGEFYCKDCLPKADSTVPENGAGAGEKFMTDVAMALSVNDFADQLILTEDLDPVYPMLVRAELDPAQLDRWLVAYWAYYHVGVASWLSEFAGDAYWKQMLEAATNQTASPLGGRWPRSPERRHFRGEKCVTSIQHLSSQTPSNWISPLRGLKTHEAVIHWIRDWPQFGPWIAFKAADMLEVVCGAPIAFSRDIPLIYKEPRGCLDLLTQETGASIRSVLDRLIEHVSQHDEPAAGRRKCGIQEAETVLCKYKSYRNGHYQVGKDTKEIRHALAGWGATADRLFQHIKTPLSLVAAVAPEAAFYSLAK
jgi:hypothetical protein